VRNPFLIGRTVYLRPLEIEDATTMQPWMNDHDVIRNLILHKPTNLQAEEEFVRRAAKREEQITFGIALRRGDRLIGTTGFHAIRWKDRSVGFGIEIGVKRLWGRGYGTEATRLMVDYAFLTLNMNRVWLKVYEDNERARRAYERVGFRKEGVLREDIWREGSYWNSLLMSVLRREWAAASPASPGRASPGRAKRRPPASPHR
jgi:diamine N-acetyltransferase